ncbi:ComEA family DNA-binding protein [Flagellimonas sp.]|uniref:ComEA family DNA-binding protein n=1 Tax=Flagellimonas sp. TaxID=2058762 RepID=UPI003F4A07B5
MKDFKSHFRFSKQERNGIFFLLLLIVLLQSIYFLFKIQNNKGSQRVVLDVIAQHQIDSLKQLAVANATPKIYPFNPNFITDYKGYILGMSTLEIDRLLEFRKTGKYVNSASEFQEVTHVSDSLLSNISPFFKFPEWTQKRAKTNTSSTHYSNKNKQPIVSSAILDLNKASAEQLMQVYGIGEKLSVRIVRFRDRLGGFLVNEQLYDVYGLNTDVVERIIERFQVIHPPEIKKIMINSATAVEIARLVYISPAQAKEIVRYREENGSIRSSNELTAMFNVSKERIDRIGLYLSFEEE